MTNLDETKKKQTVRISKKDLLKLFSENDQMAKQIAALQEENKKLKWELEDLHQLDENRPKVAKPKIEAVPDYLDEEPFPTYDPNIYFDGANGLNR